MSDQYDKMISAAADMLRDTVRKTDMFSPLEVVALHTTANRDGSIVVNISDQDRLAETLGEFTVVRPIDTPAALTGRWRDVPYSHMYQTLWNSCRSMPVLPRD